MIRGVTSSTLRGEPDWVDPPKARDEEAAETLVRHGFGAEYLDCGAWRVVGPNDPATGGAPVSSRNLREIAHMLETR